MKCSFNTLKFWSPVLSCFIFWVSVFVLHPFTLLLISVSQCLMSLTVSLSLCLSVCGVCVWWHGCNARWDLSCLSPSFYLSLLAYSTLTQSNCLFNLSAFVLTWITWFWVHFLLSSLLTDVCPSSLQGMCFSRWQRSTDRFKCS